MTKAAATARAQETANEHQMEIAIVREGLHADEFAERDEDGESYGFCPPSGVRYLYQYGEVIATVTPS